MPKFKYKAKNMNSKIVNGMADAIDESTLRKALREKDEFLLECSEVEAEKKA